jgi:hypothetical protein
MKVIHNKNNSWKDELKTLGLEDDLTNWVVGVVSQVLHSYYDLSMDQDGGAASEETLNTVLREFKDGGIN